MSTEAEMSTFKLPSAFDRRSRHWEVVLLALLIVAVTAVHLVWSIKDHGPLPIKDGYIYLTRLLRFIDAPAPSSLQEAWLSLNHLSHGGRPPLYSLLTIPSIVLFGRSVASACSVNLLFIPILLIFTYLYARSISGARAGLLAAFLVATYPPIVHLTHNYMPYSILPACGILFLWLLARLLEVRSLRTVWLFGASLAFGTMVHPQFLRFAVPTTLLYGLYLWLCCGKYEASSSGPRFMGWTQDRLMDPFFWKGLLPSALMVGALVLPWYLTAGTRLLTLTRKLNSGAMEEFRGRAIATIGFEATEPTFWFLRTAPGTLSWVLALFVLVGVFFGLIKRRPSSWLLVFSVVSTYAILERLTTRAWWSLSMVLPAAAVLTAVWIAEIRPKWIFRSLVTTCIFVGMFNFSMVNWGLNPALKPLAKSLGAPIDQPRTCNLRAALPMCPAPARASLGPLPEYDVVKLIFEDPGCQKRTCQLLILGGSISWVQLEYFTVAEYPGRTLSVVGANSPSYGRPYGLDSLLRSDFLLYPQGRAKINNNFYTTATIKFLQSPPQAFSDAHQNIEFYNQAKKRPLTLAKRVKPLSGREAESSVAALDLEERYLGQKLKMLSSLFQEEGNVAGMKRLYRETMKRPASAGTERRLRRALKKTRQRRAELEQKPAGKS
jgi:hypothetical protein